MYQRKDHYYRRAKKEGMASRAAYKLLEIQKRYSIWRRGSLLLDLGSAPGGWLQVLAKEVGPQGKVVGVDRLPLPTEPPLNVTFIQKSLEEEGLDTLLEKETFRFDAILSDLSPNLSGIRIRDTVQSYALACRVWKLASRFLKQKGNLVIKIFPGDDSEKLQKELQQAFGKLKIFIPKATRKASSEVYFVALGFQQDIDSLP